MKKTKLAVLSLGMLVMVTGCGSGASTSNNFVDDATLNSSIQTILKEYDKKGEIISYADYSKEINDYYQDNYLTGDAKRQASPAGLGTFEYSEDMGLIAPSNTEKPSKFKGVIGNGSIEYTFENVKEGRYYIQLEYYIPETFAAAALVGVDVAGVALFEEADLIALPLQYQDNVDYFEDGTKDFSKYETKYGDQMSPNVNRLDTWQTEYLYETTYSTSDPLIFSVPAGNPTITINNLGSDYFYVGNLTLVPVEKEINYNSYITNYASMSKPEVNNLQDATINAIEYAAKNTNEVTLSNEQVSSVAPHSYENKLLNVTSGWDQAGQALTWNFYVEQAGLYPLTLHYYNNLDNFPLYRRIEVNGEVPFEEVKNYEFPTTGSGYKNITVGDGENPYYFYFEKGWNEIKLTATTFPLIDIYRNLMTVYDSISDYAIKIRKITGASVDQYRTYKITQYYPSIPDVLESYKKVIHHSQQELSKKVTNGETASVLSYFQRMNELIDEFIEEPDDLPLNLTKFSSGDSCLAKLVADTATVLQSSDMILDRIYYTNDLNSLPEENASWVSSFKSSVITLGQTFGSDSKYKTVFDEEALNIWSSRPQSYNDILQTYADKEFTSVTGIKVNIRQMPSEDNLIYAYAANSVPDLVLGINSGRAFEFALRGDAAFPLSDFDSSWKYTGKNYWGKPLSPYYWDVVENMPHGQLMSMLYEDKFYSLPESTSAQLMFARDDILDVMGTDNEPIEIPETWNEVKGLLIKLQALGMNFYYPASASGSLKPLATTAQFILQNNGTIMDGTGFKSNFRDPATYEALKLLTDLYTIYALPTEVGSFYNHFRYGTYPLGIGDVGMYLQLKYVAPELLGKWSVHPIPGMRQDPQADGTYKNINHFDEDGNGPGDGGDEISRWYISNGSSAMIFNNSKRKDDAWLFLQWWMSTSIQEKFTEALQSTFGPSVVWFSANLEAAESLPFDADVREVVLQQVKWIVDLQQIPGQYMLERGLSDIWNSVVFGQSSSGEATGKITIGEAIDLEKILVDREVQRKMEEFGYYNTNLQEVVKPYKIRSYDWVEECFKNGTSGKSGGNSSTSACPV